MVIVLCVFCVCSVAQSHPTLCDPMDCSQPGSSVHGTLQAKILEWVAIPSTRGSSWHRDRTCPSHVPCSTGRLFTAEPLGKPKGFYMHPKGDFFFSPQLKNKHEKCLSEVYIICLFIWEVRGCIKSLILGFLFVCLFLVFGCAGSSLQWGLFSTWSAWASHCSDLSHCRARVLGCTDFSSCSTSSSSWTP